jgi:glycerol-3-phosphate acyltransferase PlsY
MLKVVILLAAFFIGSIPFSYIISKFFGHMDIRQCGSGNVGATNVVRNLGFKVGLLAFFLDCIKGMAACLLGYLLFDGRVAAVGGLLAVVGHCYSPFIRFSGGKGVATSVGVLLFLVPELLPFLAIVFFAVAIATKYISLASIVAAASLPLWALLLAEPDYLILDSFLLGIFVIWRHKKNVRNILSQREPKTRKRFLLF